MGDLLMRRHMLVSAGGVEPTDTKLLQQGTKTFNLVTISVSGKNVSASFYSLAMNDAYNVKRYWNITKFDENQTTGTGNTGNISNKATGRIIPAGSTCVFKATELSQTNIYSATYSYCAVILRDTTTGSLARIGFGGNNQPATSATFTTSKDTEIGCIAFETSHMKGASPERVYSGTLSLTVNGEEWL